MSSRKDLIPLDTREIRKKAIQAHRKAERALDQFKADIKRYHEKDVPGFCAWMHQNFGNLMTQQRALEKAIGEKVAFYHEIHAIAVLYKMSIPDAYTKALWRRAHPDEAEAEDRKFEEAQRRRDEERSSAQSGEEPDLDDDWDDSDIFGEGALDLDAILNGRFGQVGKPHGGDGAHPDQKTLKELYRSIVRRLHPDHHGHMTEARAALWNEAQDAYRRHDLSALHSVLARCEAGGGGIGDHTPVSLIRRMTEQLKAAARTMRQEVASARRGPAWNYETRVANRLIVQGIEREIQMLVKGLRAELAEMNGWLADLRDEVQLLEAYRSGARRKQARSSRGRRPHSRSRPETDAQSELPF